MQIYMKLCVFTGCFQMTGKDLPLPGILKLMLIFSFFFSCLFKNNLHAILPPNRIFFPDQILLFCQPLFYNLFIDYFQCTAIQISCRGQCETHSSLKPNTLDMTSATMVKNKIQTCGKMSHQTPGSKTQPDRDLESDICLVNILVLDQLMVEIDICSASNPINVKEKVQTSFFHPMA